MMYHGVSVQDHRRNGNDAAGAVEDRLVEMLQGVERSLNDLVQGLSLLGVKRCSRCQKFFRSADPGALFGSAGELICFECIPAWWPTRRDELSFTDKQEAESNLVFWLRSFHNARSLNGSGKLGRNQTVKFELLASCLECRGTGTYLGNKRCRYCQGPGTVRVVVPRKGQ